MPPLTVLHTSDWHLGHQLYHKRREPEFAEFLDWLSKKLAEHHVDVLIVAGDIFDTGSPGTGAQALYYSFLGKIAALGVRHAVIVAGNHDSPSFLSASAPILKNLQIHVTGAAAEEQRENILVLNDPSGDPELIVCACPFLREGDICSFMPGESRAEREQRIMTGLKQYFTSMAKEAEEIRQERQIPVIATAHLFTEGTDPGKEESVREIYRGNLGCVPLSFFPETFDYVALGHIHKPYAVGGNPMRRYSGSPLPLTFAETAYEKELVLLRWNGRRAETDRIIVPRFRKMLTVSGNSREILTQLRSLAANRSTADEEAWLEIKHDGSDSPAGLPALCEEAIMGANMEILSVKTDSMAHAPVNLDLERSLDELHPLEMFRRMLEHQKVPEEEWEEYEESFKELLALTLEETEPCES